MLVDRLRDRLEVLRRRGRHAAQSKPARRAAAALALLVALGALGGCGGGRAAPLSGFDEETHQTSTPPPRLVAADLARQVNLRQSDVPYLEAQPPEPDDEEDTRAGREFEDCLGARDRLSARPLAELESPSFESHSTGAFLSVQSTVAVVRSAELARKNLALGASGRAAHCLLRYLPRAIEEEGSVEVEVEGVQVRRLANPAPELGPVAGYRMTMSIGASGATPPQTVAFHPAATPPSPRIPLNVDFIGFVVGPAEISLLAAGAPTAVSRALEASLMRTMHERAAARVP